MHELWKLTVVVMPLALSGCGEFVRYDEGSAASESPDSGPGAAAAATAGDDLCEMRERQDSDAIDRDEYDAMLAARVTLADGDALLDYDAVAADDLPGLLKFLDAVACARPVAGDLAFWLNAYSANVIAAVIEQLADDPAYRVDRDGFIFFSGPRVPVAGVMMTLDELEHGVVRAEFGAGSRTAGSPIESTLMQLHDTLFMDQALDARIHVALNCAAISCPNLPTESWDGARLDAQLEAATLAFLDNPDKGAGPDGITPLMDWFGQDFVDDAGSIEAFIDAHRTDGSAGVDTNAFLEYDWALNRLRR